MAQAGVEDPTRIDEALAAGVEAVRGLLSGGLRLTYVAWLNAVFLVLRRISTPVCELR